MNEEEKETIKKMLDEIDENIDRTSECVAYLKDKYGLFWCFSFPLGCEYKWKEWKYMKRYIFYKPNRINIENLNFLLNHKGEW